MVKEKVRGEVEGAYSRFGLREHSTWEKNIKEKYKDMVERKYNIWRKRPHIVREEMKQRIKAVGVRIERRFF